MGGIPFGGTSAERQVALLERVQPCLPPLEQVRVHYYGDSEFRSVTVHQAVKDYWLEPRHKHDYSLFRLGRDHLQRACTMGCHVPVGFTVSHAG